jgi:signal transduction histidine kinase
VYETGYAFLMAEDLDYLVHPYLAYNENLTTIRNGNYAYMAELFLAESTGTIKYIFDETDKILAFSHLANGWIIAVAPPFEEVFYFYNDLRRTEVLFLLLGTIISIIVATVVGYYIAKPFQKVATDIENITSEDLAKSYVEDKHFIYEVDIIYKNFNSFSKRLGQAFQSISNQNKNLEDIVDQRTLDLKESNKQLLHYISKLETTQDLLVKAKKDQEINSLIKNIAHNLNTPLGTAITTYSYLKKIVAEENVKAVMALGIIDNNLYDMKRIIDGLNLLTSDYKATTDSLISFKTLIDSRVDWLRNQNTSIDISSHLNQVEEYKCFSNKSMLVSLFDIIMSYAIHHYEPTDIHFDIEVFQDNSGFVITFSDGVTPLADLLQFYNQSDVNSMSISNFDLDLHLLHAVVEALNGNILTESTEFDYVKWIIHIRKA